MSSLQQLKSRIRSVKSTSQLTKAMQTVAAMRFRKNIVKADKSKQFMDLVEQTLVNLIGVVDYAERAKLILPRYSKTNLFLIISPTRGFCGGLHRLVTLETYKTIEDLGLNTSDNSEVKFVTVGRPAHKQVSRLGGELLAAFDELPKNPDQYDVLAVSELLYDLYQADSSIGKVYMSYVAYPSSKIVTIPILPFDLNRLSTTSKTTSLDLFTIDSTSEKLIDELIHEYLQAEIFGAIWQTFASEEKNRMVAMNQASDNAKTLMQGLQLAYFRTRQAKITQEMAEISSNV